MQCRIQFEPDSNVVNVPTGTLISDAAKRAGVFLDAPCGGNGTCKKCEVEILTDGVTHRALACQTRAEKDCVVRIPERSGLTALQGGVQRAVAFSPDPTAASMIEGACFAAFDLGTTTVVCYLLDAADGRQISSAGRQNPQSAYGADVITRANAVLADNKKEDLRKSALTALNALIAETTRLANRTPEQVTRASIVGNTVMLHLLLGYPVEQLVRAPYAPYSLTAKRLNARKLGLNIHEKAVALIAPVIGGFVGADTVACLSATAFDTMKNPTILIDIGTNGELALTDGTRRVCCSTAAGPAFEGANISCGMRAEQGAIDHVWLDRGELAFSTIGRIPARGICGSGLIELIALLLQEGVIDEGGRMMESASFGKTQVTREGNMTAVVLSEEATRVYLTQKDIRELQLGKAAIRAGIETLLRRLSLTASDLERVLLAGAFGAHLSAAALCDIGLLPNEVRTRTESIGNAAGEGAKLYLLNQRMFDEAETLARETEYIELSLSAEFSKYFIESMPFPQSDE